MTQREAKKIFTHRAERTAQSEVIMDTIQLKGIEVDCIIGDEAWEREQKQTIRADLTLHTDLSRAGHSDRLEDTIDYAAVARAVIAYMELSTFQMLEALAEGLAQNLLKEFRISSVAITLNKRAHFPKTEGVAISIQREASTNTGHRIQ
jgi:7,8-dihydroneopterin aldolase/epimerase/oxygenase